MEAKLINGLSNIFVEKVKHQLQGDNTQINFDNYTYGQLTLAAIKEGLKLYNDIKL